MGMFFSNEITDVQTIIYTLNFLLFIWVICVSAVMYTIALQNEKISIQNTFQLTSSRLYKFLTTQILQFIVVVIPYFLLTVFLAFILGILIGGSNGLSIIIIAIYLPFILLIPYSFFGIRFIFTPFLTIDKNQSNLEALKNSYNMTKGRVFDLWKKNIGLGILFFIIFFILEIVQINIDSNSSIRSIISLIEAGFFIPLVVTFSGALYKHTLSANNAQPTA
jgi:hypothetical protein